MSLLGFKEESSELLKFLKSNPLLKDLTKKEIRKIEMITHLREFKDGEVIVQAKEPGLAIYIIKKGSASVTLGSVGENGKILQVLEEGEIFGEMSLFEDQPRSTYVIANGNAEVLGIFKHDFDALITRDIKIGFKLLYNIANLLSSRLRKVNIDLYKKFEVEEPTIP